MSFPSASNDERLPNGPSPEEGPTAPLSHDHLKSPAFNATPQSDVLAFGPSDRYRVLDVAGRGGMGIVLKAHDTVLERRVAIKISQVSESHDRMLHEARVASRLSHSNLCRVHDAGLDERGRAFIVMEWVEGAPVEHSPGKEGLPRNLALFLQVLSAVAELHRNGITHADLKPANILIDHSGRPVVVDFGLAQHQVASSATPRGGTPGYAAPEQFDPSKALTASADIFALGAILFELCVGSPPPFIRGAFIRFDPAALDAKSLEIPPPLLRICLKAMERDPADRYPTVSDLRADVQRFMRGEAVLANPSVLRNSFIEHLTAIRSHAAEWLRLGLITPHEQRSLEATVLRIQRGESYWLFDIRRLLPTTVAVLFGAWLVVLALTVGVSSLGPDLSSRSSMYVGLLTFLIAATGSALASSVSSRRFLVLWSTSALLCWPVTAWLVLRHTAWFASSDPGGELLALEYFVIGSDEIVFLDQLEGLSNLQMLVVALTTAAVASAGRLLTRTGGFTGALCLSLVLAWASVWLTDGRLIDSLTVADARARLALWTAWGLAVLGVVASVADRAEHRASISRGELAVARDAPAPMWIAAIGLVASLLTAAWSAPHRLLWAPAPEETTPIDQSHALLVTAVMLTSAMMMLGWRQTPLAASVSGVLRWFIAPLVFTALVTYEVHDYRSLWRVWLASQFCVALSFLVLSVRLQWRPFLFTAMTCIAVAYARLYVRIDEHFAAPTSLKLCVFIATAALGFVTMVIATMADPIDRLTRRSRRSRCN